MFYKLIEINEMNKAITYTYYNSNYDKLPITLLNVKKLLELDYHIDKIMLTNKILITMKIISKIPVQGYIIYKFFIFYMSSKYRILISLIMSIPIEFYIILAIFFLNDILLEIILFLFILTFIFFIMYRFHLIMLIIIRDWPDGEYWN